MNTTDTTDFSDTPVYWLRVIARRSRHAARQRMHDLGVRRGGARLLERLSEGPVSLDELSAEAIEHGPLHRRPLGMLVLRLAEAGWVAIDNGQVRLTDEGERVRTEASTVRETVEGVSRGDISDEDYAALLATLRRMAENLGWSADEPDAEFSPRGWDHRREHHDEHADVDGDSACGRGHGRGYGRGHGYGRGFGRGFRGGFNPERHGFGPFGAFGPFGPFTPGVGFGGGFGGFGPFGMGGVGAYGPFTPAGGFGREHGPWVDVDADDRGGREHHRGGRGQHHGEHHDRGHHHGRGRSRDDEGRGAETHDSDRSDES